MEQTEIVQAIEAVKKGDTAAYGLLVAIYQQRLFKHCFHMLGQVQEAEDVTQDVFVKALERLEQYQEHTSFGAWLYKLAYHECLNKIKRAQIYDRILRMFSRTMPTVQVDQVITGLAYNAELRDTLLRLNPKDRHIILLRIVEEYRFEDIAKQVDLSYAAVRKRYERAVKKMKHELNSEEAKGNERTISLF